MIFYMSQEGRKIAEYFSGRNMPDLALRTFADTVSLLFPGHLAISAINRHMGKQFRPENAHEILDRKPAYKDAPREFHFSEYIDGYRYLTEQFVVKDFGRADLLSISHMLRSYDDRAIFRLGNRCKALKKFNIPYLCATMDSEGAAVVEEIRKENRLDDLVRETIHVELGEYRPIDIMERMEDIAEERRLRNMEE